MVLEFSYIVILQSLSHYYYTILMKNFPKTNTRVSRNGVVIALQDFELICSLLVFFFFFSCNQLITAIVATPVSTFQRHQSITYKLTELIMLLIWFWMCLLQSTCSFFRQPANIWFKFSMLKDGFLGNYFPLQCHWYLIQYLSNVFVRR